MKKIFALAVLCLLAAPGAVWAQAGATVTTKHAIFGCQKGEDYITLNTLIIQQHDKVAAAHFGETNCKYLPLGAVGVIANAAPQISAVCFQPRGAQGCLWVPAGVVQ